MSQNQVYTNVVVSNTFRFSSSQTTTISGYVSFPSPLSQENDISRKIVPTFTSNELLLRQTLPQNCDGATYHSRFVDNIDEKNLPSKRYSHVIAQNYYGITETIETMSVYYGKITASRDKRNLTGATILKFVIRRDGFSDILDDDVDMSVADNISVDIEYTCTNEEKQYLEKLVDYCADYAFAYKFLRENESSIRPFCHYVTEALNKYITILHFDKSVTHAFVQACDHIFQQDGKKIL